MVLAGIQSVQKVAAELQKGLQPPHWVFGSRIGEKKREVRALRQLSGLQIIPFRQQNGLVVAEEFLKAQNELPQIAQRPFLLDIFPQQRCEVLAGQGLVGSKDQGGREGKTLGRKKCLPHRFTARGAKKPDRYQFIVPSHFRPP